jgi:hypothetical protein
LFALNPPQTFRFATHTQKGLELFASKLFLKEKKNGLHDIAARQIHYRRSAVQSHEAEMVSEVVSTVGILLLLWLLSRSLRMQEICDSPSHQVSEYSVSFL